MGCVLKAARSSVVAVMIGIQPSPRRVTRSRLRGVSVPENQIGTFSAIVGLLVSYHHDTAAGATMALAAVTIFFTVLLMRSAVVAVRSSGGRIELA